MTAGQVILILAGAVITGVMYLFAPLLPPEKENPEHALTTTAAGDFDF